MFRLLNLLLVVLVVFAQDGDDEENEFSKSVGKCVCVPYYQCKNGSIITDGGNMLDARKNSPSPTDIPLDSKRVPPNCGVGNDNFYVCCKKPGSTNENPYKHACGIRKPNGVDSRILSAGQDDSTEFGEWAWQAAVLQQQGRNKVFTCGAVLIDGTHCLTVAHNVAKFSDDPSSLLVRLGVWDAQATSEPLPHQDVSVEEITIHPEYQSANLWNDLAVLTLSKPVTYAPNVDTVCLPNYNEAHYGEFCTVTGWGKNAWDKGQFSRYLKEVQVPVLNNTQCQKMLRKTRLGSFYELNKSFICAGGIKNQDACKGDGGGPLVCYRQDGTYSLVGLVSWGIECGQPDVPGVYVNVIRFLDWICSVTGQPIQYYWPKKN